MLKKGEVKIIHKMLKDGMSKSTVARKLGINRDTVAKYAKLPEGYVPVIKRSPTQTAVDPYLPNYCIIYNCSNECQLMFNSLRF